MDQKQLQEKVKSLAQQHLADVVKIRRHLHQHPELSFQEFKTSDYIASKLKEFNIPFKQGIVKTGIVGLIEGAGKGKCVALRADMDALPIQEENNVEYKSTAPGIMHACGHDVHSACLLGAAMILSELRNEFKGSVKLLFQPGEEKLPGGASLMIAEGVLENPKPATILAQHVFPSMEAGKVGFKNGMYMASTDEVYITVKGKGGHAAVPESYNNPLFIASKILLKLQDHFMNPATKKIPDIPTVLAFGKINSTGGATNVIPEEVKIEGTFRTMDEGWRKKAHKIMTDIASEAAAEMGGHCEFNIIIGYPFLVNDDVVTNNARVMAEAYLGKENVAELPLRMTAEDFAFFSQQAPACFYRLGTGNKARGITSGVHTPTFDIDEAALETGMGLMAWLAINELRA